VRCNRGVKLDQLFQLADRLGAERLATGHYARVVTQRGAPQLWRGRDHNKDQSYFLHTLSEERLGRLTFPLGELDKAAVRAKALELALPGATKGESQELCFVPSGRYDSFVSERAPGRLRPGPIVDASGKLVGQHEGIHGFTVGQRKNLGVALGERAYVTEIEAETATVRLGPREALSVRGARLAELSLFGSVDLPLSCGVQVRYRATPVPAEIRTAEGGGAIVCFASDVTAVASGQYAVFYDGERVLGGGLIVEALREPPWELAA
jgi:tRNA-specific 2-thiouridylase